jgi:hypothetical protein
LCKSVIVASFEGPLGIALFGILIILDDVPLNALLFCGIVDPSRITVSRDRGKGNSRTFARNFRLFD